MSTPESAASQDIPPVKPRMVLLLTPTLGMVHVNWYLATANLVFPMNVNRGHIPAIDRIGGQIGQARNKLVELALQFEEKNGFDVEYVFWLDDDVLVNRMTLLSLLEHERDVAAGVYFAKGEPTSPLIFPGPGAGTSRFRPNEVFDSWGYAQGLSVVRLDVYKRMIKAGVVEKDENGCWSFYKQPDISVDKAGFMTAGGTEDFHFFHLLAKIGVVPLVDCRPQCFCFHFDNHAQVGYPKKQWEQYLKRAPLTWQTPDGVVEWR